MKKSPPRKKSVKAAATRKKNVVLTKKPAKKVSSNVTKKTVETKAVVPQKQRSPSKPSEKNKVVASQSSQLQPPLSENNPPMISLKDCTDQKSLTYFEESAVLRRSRQPKKVSRKKSRRSKTACNRSFYDPDEVDFELEDQEFLDEELISLDEFDSILNETKGKTFKERNIKEAKDIVQIDRRKTETCRKDSSHLVGPGKPARRKKVQRRRQIDPTTCERDYTADEVEFMTTLDEYKRNSGRMFPTCSEILEVLRSLGYTKATPPVVQEVSPPVPTLQEQTVINITETIPTIGPETFTLTTDNFTTEIFPVVASVVSEYHQEYLPFFLNESLLIVEMPILLEGFSV